MPYYGDVNAYFVDHVIVAVRTRDVMQGASRRVTSGRAAATMEARRKGLHTESLPRRDPHVDIDDDEQCFDDEFTPLTHKQQRYGCNKRARAAKAKTDPNRQTMKNTQRMVTAYELDSMRASEDQLSRHSTAVQGFYKHQNHVILGLMEMEATLHVPFSATALVSTLMAPPTRQQQQEQHHFDSRRGPVHLGSDQRDANVRGADGSSPMPRSSSTETAGAAAADLATSTDPEVGVIHHGANAIAATAAAKRADGEGTKVTGQARMAAHRAIGGRRLRQYPTPRAAESLSGSDGVVQFRCDRSTGSVTASNMNVDSWRRSSSAAATDGRGSQSVDMLGGFELHAPGAVGDVRTVLDREHQMNRLKYAIGITFGANLILFVLKVLAAVQSHSLAVIASALDSLLDLLSGMIMVIIARAVRRNEPYKYPVSKGRLEPVGIIIFASVMGTASLLILQDALEVMLRAAATGERPVVVHLSPFTASILGVVVVVKLGLYVYCRALLAYLWRVNDRSGGSSGVAAGGSGDSSGAGMIEALVQDHRNDIMTNLLGGACAAAAGFVPRLWALDPVGAMILSSYIIFSWVQSGREQVAVLVGASAPPAFIGQLVYLAAHHDPRIIAVDKVLAYHFGGLSYICEVDIILPPDMRLRETHDIGESLEVRIEQLPLVQRAFVHVDFNDHHAPEHRT